MRIRTEFKPPVRASTVPLATNKRASLTLNLKMANAAGILLPVETLKAASKVIGQEALY